MSHLVLSRRVNESVVLTVPPSSEPTEIEVQNVRLGPNAVRLGFRAPEDVVIVRSELRSEAETAWEIPVAVGQDHKPPVDRAECD